MVDNFSILLTHGLMAIALWRLLHNDALDHEVSPRSVWHKDQLDKAAEAADNRHA
ncbi:MAG: hypothetical protein RLZZ58_1780 [Pseudomonadota bacterium]